MKRSIVPVVLVLFVACGPTARDKALSASLLSVNAARDGLVAFDAEHQAQIVDHATSREDVVAKLASYRKARARVTEAFAAAYGALAAAAINKDTPLPTALAVVADLHKAITDLKQGGTP